MESPLAEMGAPREGGFVRGSQVWGRLSLTRTRCPVTSRWET